MIRLFYFIRLAILHLLRGGQRVLVAWLCIIFGTMALVAMMMLASPIQKSVEITPAQLIGGDISLGRKAEDTLRPQDIAQLETLRQDGTLSDYTQIAFNSSILFHRPGSGEIHFIGSGLGVEPDNYPLAGSLRIAEPGNTGLPTLLQQVGDVVVTRDVAKEYHLKVGDPLILADLRLGAPLPGVVRAIANDTPNHWGDKIYYSVQTAQALANGQPAVNTVIANSEHPEAASAALESSGWTVNWAAGRENTRNANLWVISLRGAGILGLLVGGIGIANTMQVLLRRRQREIAIWKTLGYRAGDLRWMFALEAGLLGLAGSLLGAGLGVLLSAGLLELFQRTSTLLYEWRFSLQPPLLGVLVGTLTTVIFASWAILLSSQARPMALLRNEAVEVQALPWRQSLGLGLLLAAPFTALASLAMGSLAAGIGVLIGILFGIVALGGIFSGLLWVCTRCLPGGRLPLVGIARRSLKRRRTALVFAMIALFTGVLSMSLGLVVTQKGMRSLPGGIADSQGYNLNILAAPGQEDAVLQALAAQKPERVGVGYRLALSGLSIAGGGGPLAQTEAVLVGRSDPQDYLIRGAEWGSRPDGVYAFAGANLAAGSQVEVAFQGGVTQTFPVVGSYTINYASPNLVPPNGLLLTAEAFGRVARPDALTYFVRVASGQLDRATRDLGAALPQATVVDLAAYANRFMQSYRNLFLLPLALAGLALLAGCLLVANSVSLAMLDRRYEIGILKAVGYAPGHLLTIFAVEYGLVGLIAGGAGVLLIEALLALLAVGSHLAVGVLLLSLPSLALVALFSLGLTLLTALGVTWGPSRAQPAAVLNERA